MALLLGWLIRQGKPQLALEVAQIFLNWYNVKGFTQLMQRVRKNVSVN